MGKFRLNFVTDSRIRHNLLRRSLRIMKTKKKTGNHTNVKQNNYKGMNIMDIASVSFSNSDCESVNHDFSYNSDIDSDNEVCEVQNENRCLCGNFDNSINALPDTPENFKRRFKECALKSNIPHSTINELLEIYRSHKCFSNFPKDARTLLGTVRDVVVNPGFYYHFGIQNGIESGKDYLLKNWKNNDNILKLQTHIDGIPLAGSSKSHFYTILGSLSHSRFIFVIGIYWGYQHPNDPNEFLYDMISELKTLTQTGFYLKYRHVSVILNSLVCDAPAKAFVLNVKCHSGYSSCTKCTITGEHSGCICFADLNDCPPRTKESFIMMTDENYHLGYSTMVEIPHFDPAVNVPLDYMHLLCQGVTKRLIKLWFEGKPPYKLQSHKVRLLSKKILQFKHSFPIEFARKPRGLDELKYWKAMEFRTFLLYLGPIVLKDILPKRQYANFMALHCASYILININSYGNKEEMITFAHDMMKFFVVKYQKIYKKRNMTFNIHNVRHLSLDVRKFGALDSLSAFKFENFLQLLKKKKKEGR